MRYPPTPQARTRQTGMASTTPMIRPIPLVLRGAGTGGAALGGRLPGPIAGNAAAGGAPDTGPGIPASGALAGAATTGGLALAAGRGIGGTGGATGCAALGP